MDWIFFGIVVGLVLTGGLIAAPFAYRFGQTSRRRASQNHRSSAR